MCSTCVSSVGTSSYVLESVEVLLEEVAHLGSQKKKLSQSEVKTLSVLLWTFPDIPNLTTVSLTGRSFEQHPECVRWFPHQRSRNAGTPGLWQSPFPRGWRRAIAQVHQSCSPNKTHRISDVLTIFTKKESNSLLTLCYFREELVKLLLK